MSLAHASRLAFERIVVRARDYAVFTAAPGQMCARRDDDVAAWDRHTPPPPSVRDLLLRHSGALVARMMLRRLARGQAVLLTLLGADDLRAYGWLQMWAPLRREFWWLAGDGICLGPYWTHPDERGRGVYGRMLAHSLAECRARFPQHEAGLYIWANARNIASIRGIEKAGFRPLGVHRVSTFCGGLFRRHRKLSSSCAALPDARAERAGADSP